MSRCLSGGDRQGRRRAHAILETGAATYDRP